VDKKPYLQMLRLRGSFNPKMHELFEMLTTTVAMNDDRWLDLLGGINKTSYSDGINAN